MNNNKKCDFCLEEDLPIYTEVYKYKLFHCVFWTCEECIKLPISCRGCITYIKTGIPHIDNIINTPAGLREARAEFHKLLPPQEKLDELLEYITSNFSTDQLNVMKRAIRTLFNV